MTKRRDILEKAAKRGKYAPLFNHLKGLSQNELPCSFEELERVLGFDLPDSARIHRPWWANQGMRGGHSHALAWEMAGWKTSQVDMGGERLVFIKDRKPDHSAQGGDQYWVYVNEPNNVTTIHIANCSFCNNGKGLKENKSKNNGEWFGPYSEEQATQKAIHAKKQSTVRCGHCL